MITLLEKSKSIKGRAPSYAVTNNRKSATHFQQDDGPLQLISELKLVQNEPKVEPLGLPTINFSTDDGPKTKKKQTGPVVENENVLVMPTINFDEEEPEAVTKNKEAVQPLAPPSTE